MSKDSKILEVVSSLRTWNYRVVEDEYGTHMIEAHYDKKGKLVAWTEDGRPFGDDIDDLILELKIRLKTAKAAKKNPKTILPVKKLPGVKGF